MEEVERIKYIIKPTYKKSALEEQYWTNTLENGKTVTVKVNNVYRWGEFYIDLSDKEKEDILKKEMINLSEYEHELIEMWDGGCDFWIDVENEEELNEEELEEVESLLYNWKKIDDVKKLSIIPEEDQEDYDDDDEGYSYEKMEHNGWYETECEYVITSTCELNKVMEYECHE